MNQLTMHTDSCRYPITVSDGALSQVGERFRLDRRVLILTDSGVPEVYAQTVADACADPHLLTVPPGEKNKCPEQLFRILQTMLDAGFTRQDAVVAVGGGVIGDVGGLAAALYMRGIDFYNIPTTILSQVDSSVGGKVAIDMGSYKNIVGAFWQPKAVIIDPNVLSTLSLRQQHNGLCEALKMGLILDDSLVCEFEKDTLDIDKIITRSIELKKEIVQQDERESNLRKILNFGHTIGHAIEGAYGLNTYLHGECVAMGMLFFINNPELKKRVLSIYKKLSVPTVPDYDIYTLMEYIMHDKKSTQSTVSTIQVDKSGSYLIKDIRLTDIKKVLERGPYEE